MLPISARIRAAAPGLYPAHLVRQARGARFSLADAIMVGTMVIWSLNVISVKVAVGVISPLGFGLLRYSLATCLLFPLLRRREGTIRARRADIGWLALAGACGFGLNQTAFLLGIHMVSASLAAIILATAPLLTAVAAALWAREPLRPRTLLALAISFGGVLVVIAGTGVGGHVSWTGGLLILGAAAMLALAAIWAKWPLQHASSLRVTTWLSLFGTITLFPLGLPALLATPWSSVTPQIIGAAAFTVIGSTIIGNLGWNYAIQQLGAARTTTYTYLQPVMGVIFAILLLGERLAAVQVLGGVVVLLGLLVYPRRNTPNGPAAPAVPDPTQTQ
jgi:drug/metabolite transporter (DMT)-like permease